MQKIRILVIEDDDDARMMYGIMLRSWGYEILEATTGGEGIKVAKKHKPDLILLDVMMPDMDGYHVCNQLREDPAFQTVPILFLSALDATDDRIKGYDTGGDDFITKGQIDYKELGARIQAALRRTQRMQPQAAPVMQKSGGSLALLSLRGGVGVSTIAVNLARQAAARSERPIILIDLAFPIGSASLWMGISGARHIVELLSRPPVDITMQTVSNFSLQNVHGFHFIPAPATLTDLSSIRVESVERLLHVLHQAGYFAILDLGRATLPLLWHVPAHCDWTGVITSADRTARALTQVALEALPKQGVSQQSLILIFNDAQGAKPNDVSTGLPRSPDIFIPHTRNFQQLPEPSPLTRLWGMVAPEEDAAPNSTSGALLTV